jgi:hypothetical protein
MPFWKSCVRRLLNWATTIGLVFYVVVNCVRNILYQPKSRKPTTTIKFHHYVPFTKCSKHGPLVLRAKVCSACEELQENEKKGKLQTQKERTLLCCQIGIFHRDYYLPALDFFAYHTSHVTILSKTRGAVR